MKPVFGRAAPGQSDNYKKILQDLYRELEPLVRTQHREPDIQRFTLKSQKSC